MASRGLNKVIRAIYLNSNETDGTKRTFDPYEYPVNWNKAVKYIQAKDRQLSFNKTFRPLFLQIYNEDIKTYLAGGHKLTSYLKKEIKQNAKEKAKEIIKTQAEVKAASQQDHKESQGLLPEAD